MERPQTPPGQIIPPNATSPPPFPRKTIAPWKWLNIETPGGRGPFYWQIHKITPDFEVPPLIGGDFRERPTVEECADKLGLKLPSGESILSRRPDPSQIGVGARPPPSIKKLDHLLEKGDEDPMSLSGMSSMSEPKSKPGAFLKLAEGLQENADQKDSKPSFQKSKKSNPDLGLMLPPPRKAPGGQQKKQTPKSSTEESNDQKEVVGGMPQRLVKGAALLQEMADVEKPREADKDRAQVLQYRLTHVQTASRRMQGHLGIHSDETWSLPKLPDDPNLFILETNATKIRAVLENCSAFAVTTGRESGKSEFLDVIAKYGVKRVVIPAGQVPEIRLTSFEDEKKANETEASDAVARMMDEGLEEAQKDLEDEGMSEVPSSPKSLFHSVGPTPANSAGEDEELPTTSEGSSSVDTEERERREQSQNPDTLDIGSDAPESDGPESGASATPDSANRSDVTGRTPEWVYRENATPNPHYDREGNEIPYITPAGSSDDQEMRTSANETDTASAASRNISVAITAPSQELGALSVHDSEARVTQSIMDEAMAVTKAQDKGKGKEASASMGETLSHSPDAMDEREGKETSSNIERNSLRASQDQYKGKLKQKIQKFQLDTCDAAYLGEKMGFGRGMLDVAGSLRNHSLTFVESETEESKPPVPQADRMPKSLTEAICSYIPLEAKPILTLTLERVDPHLRSPTFPRCILLKHFEVGLDGVEGLCQGTAKIPETPEATAERERRVGKLGTFRQGDGGFYRVLKHAQQKEQQHGKGYWYFFGVKFKQTDEEREYKREDMRGGKWLLFGAPIEAVEHLDLKRNQENVTIMLGGGVDGSGTAIHPFSANFKRTQTLFSRGGIAPMDIWPGGEDWDDGVFGDIRVALAHNGLRVGFLYADTQNFPTRPRGFPAAGKNQDEKKRKQAGPDMTEEEVKAMEKSLRPKKLSAEDIGAILVTKIINERAEQDAAARSK